MGSNILIVEDHELTRFGLKTAFETCDYVDNIYEAESAEDCLEIIKNNTVDLVVMDLGLPGMDGIEATQRIKDFLPDVKILIFTSRDSEYDVFESFRAGADGYIMKGASPEQGGPISPIAPLQNQAHHIEIFWNPGQTPG